MANVRDFQYVAEIARHGSISKAAEALYLSQPTLTKFLQKAEQEVGMPLFHRVGKKFVPTLAGEIYVEKAHSILTLSRQMELELDSLAKMRSGSVRFGITAGRTEYVMSAVLSQFSRKYPGIQLFVSVNHTEQLLKMLSNNELDIVLANYNGEKPAIAHEYISEEELALVVPKESPLILNARRREGFLFPVIYPDSWKNEPFVLTSTVSRSYRLAQEYFYSLGIQPQLAAEFPDIRSVISAVQAGIGISIFISVPIPEYRGIEYLSLGRTDIPRQRVAVLTRPGICLNEAQEMFIQMLREAFL